MPATRIVLGAVGVVVFGALGSSAYEGNMARSTYRGEEANHRLVRLWQMIPNDAPVFPGFLFRPLSSPIPYGHYYGDIPQSILSRYPSALEILDRQKTPFIILNDEYFQKFPLNVQQYIQTHYDKGTSEPDLWKRTN